jgi:hypothetical protein
MRDINGRLVRIRYGVSGTCLLMLGAAWLTGCTGNSVKSTWQGASQPGAFKRIMIVALSTDFTQRCSFEFALASQFQDSSTIPIVSCNNMMPKDALTRANIERFAAASHADAVLTSAVVTMSFQEHQGNTADTRATPYYQVTGVGYVTGDLGAYGVPVAFVKLDTTASIPQVNGEIHVLTKLYSTPDATLVYTLDTQTKSVNMQSDSDTIETITGQIGDRLHKDGVIH